MFLYFLCALLLLNAFTTEACMDAGPTEQCKEWKAEGKCKDPSMQGYMQAFCANTCRFCGW
ncbi:shTK domain protein [Teladorsagia circumcincta]|uniref:ShTK domain protein n=1 Tax=Teladorsagia circumcincta TaxID=45464 RepID=A0A2G9UD77_TELCI|nr:shTK domain protein [Teladorsagia circumcincta]